MLTIFNEARYQELHAKRVARIDAELANVTNEDQRFTLSRQKGLGGSDMGTLMGLNKWSTVYKVWKDKTGRGNDFEGNLQTAVGSYLEDFVAQLYENQSGFHVSEVKSMAMKQVPFIVGNFDRLVTDAQGIIIGGLECKTTGMAGGDSYDWNGQIRHTWGDANLYDGHKLVRESNLIDPKYYAQVQTYLAISGLEWWDLAVLISNNDFRIYRVRPDAVFIEKMITEAERFWCLNVLEDCPPDMVFADAKDETANGESFEAPAELIKLCAEYKTIRAKQDAIDQELQPIKDKIAAVMGSFSKATYKDESGKTKSLVTFSGSKRTSFDSKTFEKENPDLYKHYLKSTVTARALKVN